MDLSAVRIRTGLTLMMRTLPIVGIRLGATMLFWLVAAIYLALAFFIATLLGSLIEILGIIFFFVALVGVVPLYKLAYHYVFYMIKAAHIAVLAEIIANDRLPSGKGQLEWGRERVQERFGEMNAMFVIDELVEGVVKAFTRSVYRFTWFLPGESIDTLVRLINRVIENSVKYIDEAILARSFWRESSNVWVNARDGLVLYGQVWRPILMNAIALLVLSYVPSVVAFVVFAAPIGFLLALISTQLAAWTIVFALLFAFLIKVAIGDAFAMAVIISAYYRETADLKPNPEMAATLDNLSDQFGEITQRAREEMQKLGRRKATNPSEDTSMPNTPDADPNPNAPTSV